MKQIENNQRNGNQFGICILLGERKILQYFMRVKVGFTILNNQYLHLCSEKGSNYKQ